MKILLVSDSHGDDGVLKSLVKEYPNMDYYLHAGDSQSDAYTIFPFDSVKGNCDSFPFDNCRRIYTPKGYLYMKHFPFLNNKEKDFAFFVHGHTHRYEIKKEKEYVAICPGSVSHPRDGSLGTYCYMEINEKEANIFIIELETKNILKRMKL